MCKFLAVGSYLEEAPTPHKLYDPHAEGHLVQQTDLAVLHKVAPEERHNDDVGNGERDPSERSVSRNPCFLSICYTRQSMLCPLSVANTTSRDLREAERVILFLVANKWQV